MFSGMEGIGSIFFSVRSIDDILFYFFSFGRGIDRLYISRYSFDIFDTVSFDDRLFGFVLFFCLQTTCQKR